MTGLNLGRNPSTADGLHFDLGVVIKKLEQISDEELPRDNLPGLEEEAENIFDEMHKNGVSMTTIDQYRMAYICAHPVYNKAFLEGIAEDYGNTSEEGNRHSY